MRRIAELCELGLEPHVAADPLERLEAAPLPRELIRPQDLLLSQRHGSHDASMM